jgi:transcriptional regulator with GAF, ATPase, and Fis domain
MALIAFSPTRSNAQEELHAFERLLADLSSSFATVEARDAQTAVARALGEIGMALGLDACTLVEFPANQRVSLVHAWAAPPHQPCRDEDLASIPWVLQRLSRNAVIALTPEMDLPQAAAEDRSYAQRTGMASLLGVPIALGARVVYGLIAGRHQRQTDWRTPFVDRLRLAGEVIGVGLERRRLEDACQVNAQAREPREPAGASGDMLYLREEARNQIEADQIIGENGGLRDALTRLSQVAAIDATVLLLGETGTGKELFARALHDRSGRRTRAMIRVNCAALPPSLIESELFGHERGAFTGAISTRQGRFELADGGTIFLDEIGDLAPDLQVKLLRVLQEGEFQRVGSSKSRSVDVRVIAATHVNLEQAVAEGRFRADLYYRLSVFPIHLPPLRERREDIPQLVWFLIHRRQRELRRRIARIPDEAMQALQEHDWPGNVRELENVVERAMIRSTDATLRLDDLPRVGRLPAAGATACGDSLDALQRAHIERVLRECGGRINGMGFAADRLGIHPNTLRFRIKKLGVMMPERRSRGGAVAGVN